MQEIKPFPKGDRDELTLWIGAFRYYLGRKTYAVSDFCELLIVVFPTLSGYTRDLIRKEIASAFERSERSRSMGLPPLECGLGDPCDVREWEKVRDFVEKYYADSIDR